MATQEALWQRMGLALVAALVLYCMFVLAQPVLVPCATALVVAYLANPAVSALHKRYRMPRVCAALVVLLGVVTLLLVGLVFLMPLLATQILSLFESALPALQRMQLLAPQWFDEWRQFLPPQVADALRGNWQNVLSKLDADTVQASADLVLKRLTPVIAAVLSGAQTIFSLVNFFVLMPILAFYFLADWPSLCHHINSMVPQRHQQGVQHVAHEVDNALASYLRGQFLVCVVQSAYYVAALSMIGIPYSVLIGSISGFMTFIPYIGAIFGYLAAVIVLILVQGFDLNAQLILGCVFVIGQLLEGYVWVPRLVGNSVGLHPAWTVIALAVCGSLFGFMGLLLAMPVAAVLAVLVRLARQRYITSAYYTQHG